MYIDWRTYLQKYTSCIVLCFNLKLWPLVPVIQNFEQVIQMFKVFQLTGCVKLAGWHLAKNTSLYNDVLIIYTSHSVSGLLCSGGEDLVLVTSIAQHPSECPEHIMGGHVCCMAASIWEWTLQGNCWKWTCLLSVLKRIGQRNVSYSLSPGIGHLILPISTELGHS